jgi:hypothetical protein
MYADEADLAKGYSIRGQYFIGTYRLTTDEKQITS